MENAGKRGKGRPKGSKTKPKDSKEWIIDFLENDRDQAVEDYRMLTPKERWNVRIDLIGFTTAKPQSVVMENTTKFVDASLARLEEMDKEMG